MVPSESEAVGGEVFQIEQRPQHAPKQTVSIITEENSHSAMPPSKSISPQPIPIPPESASPLGTNGGEAAPSEESAPGQGQSLGNVTPTARASTASPPAAALLDSGFAASSADVYGGAQSSMPRNFRLSLDGYALRTDHDGTYAAYRISVTAGLHTWLVFRRYRQFLSLHSAVSKHVKPDDMPHLPGKRILGSSVDPSFAEARGLALQVYLRQLVCVGSAWRVPQLTSFLDEPASMMGVQTQIGNVLDQMDRMGSLCVDLQHQLSLSQMQVQGQNELVETLCRRLQHMEQEHAAALSAAAAAAAAVGGPENVAEASADLGNPETAARVEGTGVAKEGAAEQADPGALAPAAGAPPRRRASTGPTFQIGTGDLQSPYHGFGAGPGMRRRVSSISIAAAAAAAAGAGIAGPGGAGFGGTSVPTASIDMSDLNNLVKRVESANQLAMPVASDDEDDDLDHLLEHQHQRMMMRSSSAYSLASNPESSGQRLDRRESTDFFYMGSIDTGGITQGIKGLLAEAGAQEAAQETANTSDPAAVDKTSSGSRGDRGEDEGNDGSGDGKKASRPKNAAVPITIPVPEGSMPSKVWERLQKGGSLLGDPEERMMAEGQDGNTPGSGLVKDISRSMFGLSSPPAHPPPNAPRWSSSLGAMFGMGGAAGGDSNAHPASGATRGGADASGGGAGGGAEGAPGGIGGLLSEAEDDPLPLDILPGNKQPLAIDRRVEDLLRLLRPARRADGYRRSVFRFVTAQVKRALGAQCFPVGGYAIQTYLPDEEVGISAFLCRGQEKSWFVRVNETLCKVSSEASEQAEAEEGTAGGGDQATAGSGGDAGGGSGGGGAEEGEGSTYRHRLSNVNFINMGRLQRIKCVVDNQVAVDIGANQVGDIATVALLEETDQLLGKNHLFKRSLLLIKSWWVYESRAYTGSNMLSRITEAALATMVLAVVNQHHARLHTPLQVMALFFQMHSHFDWSRYCWCIEGARRLDTLHTNTSADDDASAAAAAAAASNGGGSGEGVYGAAEAFGGLAGHPAPLLLSQEVLNRYRLRQTGRGRGNRGGGGSNSSHVPRHNHHQQSGTLSKPTGEKGEQVGTAAAAAATAAGGVLVGGAAVAGPGSAGPGTGKEGAGGVAGAAGGGESGANKKKLFPIRSMNVMNPLDSSDNQIDDTVNRRRAARMHSLLQMGARQLRPVLMHLKREVTKAQQGQPGPPHPAHVHTTSVAMLETFFSLSWARFGQGWRPDVPPHLDRDHGENEKIPWSMYDHDYNFFAGVGGAGGANSEAFLSSNAAAGCIEAEGEGVEGGGEGERALTVAGAGEGSAGGGKQRDPFHVDLQSVRDSVKYCCFLLEAEVTDSALLALSKEILSDKGSLPVGEIGKLLQEATSNPSLSQTLKDQFGGLKKFLEKYPGEFVIAADHPFNPHVYLKSALTAEDLDTVLRGGTVVQNGTGGGGGGIGGAAGGGAKKHKSKSGRRRSGANKQAGQQHQQQHQGQGQEGAHLRPMHAQISQQQQQQQQMREDQQLQMRALQHQHQHEGMHGALHRRQESQNPPMPLHRERQQHHDQGLLPREVGRLGDGDNGVLGAQHGRSGLHGVAPPPRIPTRQPPLQLQQQQQQQQQRQQQRLLQSPLHGQGQQQQHDQRDGPRRQQQQQHHHQLHQRRSSHHHGPHHQQQQQQQQEEDPLAAMYLQQSADSLAAAGDLFRGSSAQQPRRMMSGLGGALAQRQQQQELQQQQREALSSRGGGGGNGQQVRDGGGLDRMWEADISTGRPLRPHTEKLQAVLQGRGGGRSGGDGSRNRTPVDPWGNQVNSNSSINNPSSQQQQQQHLQGSGALSGIGGDPQQLADLSGGLVEAVASSRDDLAFKTLQSQQQQRQQHQQYQHQHQQDNSGYECGLDGLLSAVPPRNGSPFYD